MGTETLFCQHIPEDSGASAQIRISQAHGRHLLNENVNTLIYSENKIAAKGAVVWHSG